RPGNGGRLQPFLWVVLRSTTSLRCPWRSAGSCAHRRARVNLLSWCSVRALQCQGEGARRDQGRERRLRHRGFGGGLLLPAVVVEEERRRREEVGEGRIACA